MGARVRVDGERLRTAGSVVGTLADGVRGPVSAEVVGLVDAGAGVGGSAFAGSARLVAEVLAPVTGDLARALHELGRGMAAAADRYRWVDTAAAAAYAVVDAPGPVAAPGEAEVGARRAMPQ